jgi:cytochrome c oxidase assembly factor CtaG/cytochrome c2
MALHAEHLVAPAGVWGAWNLDPLVLLGLGATAWAYASGVRAAWRSAGTGRGIGRAHVAAFAGAMTALAVALVSPVDRLGGTLFSAHMVQHLLLILAAAPLLVLAAPDRAFTWALPRAARRGLGRLLNRDPVRGIAGWLTRPLTAWLLHSVVLWVWHIPGPYAAALESDAIHALEHAGFFVTALLFWWVVLRPPRRRAAYGLGVLFVFATAMQSGVLGALITFAGSAWYPAHAEGAALWGLTALEDQQLAGLVMWVPAGLVYVLAAGLLCAAWLERPRPRAARAVHSVPRNTVLLAAATLLGACERGDAGAPRVSAVLAGADAEAGRSALRTYGCVSCHYVPGVRDPGGRVGPTLADFGRRAYIAGGLPNTPDQVMRWIQDPQTLRPGTAMPDLDVPEPTARDIAAYLYTLR